MEVMKKEKNFKISLLLFPQKRHNSPVKTFFRSRPAQIGLAAFALLNFAHAGVMAQGVSRAYFANDPIGRNLVTILSQAPLETMLTRTGAVEADIKINPQNVLDKPYARFQIPVASLDTGIKMRNEHMMGAEWLDAAKYPNITFTLAKSELDDGVAERAIPLAKGREEADVEGELEFHGVKKTVRAHISVEVIPESEATKTRLAGELMHIKGSFPLKLSDFGIVVPAMAKLKVADDQWVTVDVFVSTGSKAPEWSAATTTNGTERGGRFPIGSIF